MVKQVRALERGLDLLEVLNGNDGADIAWLAEHADLPR
ncbi:MAG: transcriptional regulator, partial [Rhodospirillaceae bacterium]|nr:transcriptional regulator [Rhodospirillaceae bacterium]